MTQTDEQIIELVSAALESAMELAADDEGWKVEKEQGEATVKSKKNNEGKKVWLCSAVVETSPKDLWAKLLDTDNLTTWNTTLTESRTIKTLEEGVKVSYQVTAGGGGGIVSPRDFVYGFKTQEENGVFTMGGLSVEVADQPEQKGCVRAVHGPGCQVIQPVEGEPGRSKFIWLMDCDYKGMLPTSVIEIAMPSAQLQMIDCINNID